MPNQLSVVESSVLRLIPKGKGNRRPLSEISKLTKLDVRTVQSVINRLVITHDIPICAVRDGGGIFIPTDEKERLDGLKSLKNQVLEMSKRIAAVEKTDLSKWSEKITLSTQEELEV